MHFLPVFLLHCESIVKCVGEAICIRRIEQQTALLHEGCCASKLREHQYTVSGLLASDVLGSNKVHPIPA